MSKDTLEVMGVRQSVMVSRLDWCDSGVWGYLQETNVTLALHDEDDEDDRDRDEDEDESYLVKKLSVIKVI